MVLTTLSLEEEGDKVVAHLAVEEEEEEAVAGRRMGPQDRPFYSWFVLVLLNSTKGLETQQRPGYQKHWRGYCGAKPTGAASDASSAAAASAEDAAPASWRTGSRWTEPRSCRSRNSAHWLRQQAAFEVQDLHNFEKIVLQNFPRKDTSFKKIRGAQRLRVPHTAIKAKATVSSGRQTLHFHTLIRPEHTKNTVTNVTASVLKIWIVDTEINGLN